MRRDGHNVSISAKALAIGFRRELALQSHLNRDQIAMTSLEPCAEIDPCAALRGARYREVELVSGTKSPDVAILESQIESDAVCRRVSAMVGCTTPRAKSEFAMYVVGRGIDPRSGMGFTVPPPLYRFKIDSNRPRTFGALNYPLNFIEQKEPERRSKRQQNRDGCQPIGDRFDWN